MQESKKQKTGIYVHIPFCRSRCSYCGFVSCTQEKNVPKYVRALAKEIAERVHGEVDSVYVGGGTPSVLPRGCFTAIFDVLEQHAHLTDDCEITTEANPDSCTSEFLHEVIACGVNRLSLGVQSLNDDILRTIGRRHTAAQAKEAVLRAQKEGMKNISCDLMLGLPEQTQSDVEFAVNALCDWGVTHISVYALAVEESTPLHKSGYRIDEDKAADLYDAAYETLRSRGFDRYEVSNFARGNYICKHNYKYWTRAPYIGVGAAAHSFDGKNRAYNTSDIAQYTAGDCGLQRCEVSPAEAVEEYVMLGLRTRDGISLTRLAAMGEPDWQERRSPVLQQLTQAGLIETANDTVRLTDKAFYVMNEVIIRLL